MEGSGVSLFQGSEMLKLNLTNIEEDEAEAFEEEKRKNDQLREMLSDAFDDLHIDEHDASFVSGAHSMNNTNDRGDGDEHPTKETNASSENGLSAHYKHCYHNNHNNIAYMEQREPPVGAIGAGSDMEQLAELYGVRMREIARLQEGYAAKESEWKKLKEHLEGRALQLEAEKNAAQISNSQAQKLLVNGKEQISELLSNLENLNERNKELDQNNNDLNRQLMMTRTEVETLQAKVMVLERSSSQRTGEIHADAMVRSLQDRHRREISNLQSQYDALTAKLEATESSLRQSERRVWEVTRAHEAMLLERGESVNKLARALEESQRHCQQLVAEKQQPDLAAALTDKQNLQKQVSKLQKELEQAHMDIEQLETMVGLGALTGDTGYVKESAKKPGLDNINRLKEELARSLRNQETRRVECHRLQQELRDRELELNDMRQQETKYQQVVTALKSESEKLLGQVQSQRHSQISTEDFNKYRQEIEYRNIELQGKVKVLEEQNKTLAEHAVELQRICDEEKLQALDEHSTEYLAFHQRAVNLARQQEREQAEQLMKQIRHELEMERQGSDQVKAAYVELAQAKATLCTELEQLKEKLTLQEKQKDKTETVIETNQTGAYVVQNEPPKEESNEKTAELPSSNPELQAEVDRLRQALVEQAERMRKERREAEEKAWGHFREELQRVADHENASKILPVLPDVTSQSDLENQIRKLETELEETKTKHANRLSELQAHLREKHAEMEEFKVKFIEYSKLQVQTQEKESAQYIETLKQEIQSLNTELSENKKISDTERQKLNEQIQSLSAELKTLKNEKAKESKLYKKLSLLQENVVELKDYYERREEFLQQQFRKHEEHCYENRLKLKAALHSLNEIEFPRCNLPVENPTKDK